MQAPQGFDATHSDEMFLVLESLEEMKDRPAWSRYQLRRAKGLHRRSKNFGTSCGKVLASDNRQRATMQTPQGLDAKHRDELFPVLEFLEEMEDRPA